MAEKLKISLVGARANSGLTQARAAELCHMELQRLARAEKSEDPKLTIGEIKKLCEIYGVTLEDLDY